MSKAPAQKPSAIFLVINGFELPAAKRFAPLGSLFCFYETKKGYKMKKIFLLIIPALLLMSCVTDSTTSFIDSGYNTASALPAQFTSENLMKVHQGMSSDEILTLFGEPKNIDISICGMPPNQWTCTTWEYGRTLHDFAHFTFSGKHDSLKLNDFDVNKR